MRRGGFVELSARVRGASERHVFLVEIANPEGIVHHWNRFTMDGPRGTAHDRVHIALDAPAGQWSITCTEVVSGRRDGVQFEVEEQ
jgi:hypothetical protein